MEHMRAIEGRERTTRYRERSESQVENERRSARKRERESSHLLRDLRRPYCKQVLWCDSRIDRIEFAVGGSGVGSKTIGIT